MKSVKILSVLSVATIVGGVTHAADALQYRKDRFALRVTGFLDGGIIEPDFESPLFIGDGKLRAQANYAVAAGQTLGLVYSLDAQRIQAHRYVTDAFMLFEDRGMGRIEFGLTESIAAKLGLGLPDVGGLRMNDNPIFYKRISPHGTVVTDTTLDTGFKALRVNLASAPTNPVQYGLSVAGLTDDYKFAVDAGAKWRRPAGKLKTALSLGASFMDAPDNFYQSEFSPRVTADWRAQGTVGLNLQYNSIVWGTTFRAIYDQNPVGTVSDGIAAGTGFSYDLLQYTVSLSYIFSDTGIWHSDIENYTDHTVIASLRYKYSENVSGWMSVGMTTETPFLAVGLRIGF